MARKKPPIKPISVLRFEFQESLENLCQCSLMMLQVVTVVLEQVPDLPGHDILAERAAELRKALVSDD
jgi:hypothetical protein